MGDLITYDGENPFEFQADPLISKNTTYLQAGERWGTLETITLDGVLTGCSFTDIYESQMELIQSFCADFKTLQVEGFDDFERCKINGVNFSESTYLSSAPYTIELQSYGTEDSFLETYGVINPVSSISYTENSDKSVGATRSISAKGVSIPSKTDALQNARDFVAAYTGQSRPDGSTPNSDNWVMAPSFAGTPYTNPSAPMILQDRKQAFNRFTAEISLTENYVIDATGDADFNSSFILRYTEDSQSSPDSEEQVSVAGSVRGSKYSPLGIDGAFAYYTRFKDQLGEIIINESITQDVKNNSIEFSFDFERGFKLDIIVEPTISISENSDTSLISVNINGNIYAKNPRGEGVLEGGDCRGKVPAAYQRVLKFFEDNTPADATSLWYKQAQSAYDDYVGIKGPLARAGGARHPTTFVPLTQQLTLNPQPLSHNVNYAPKDASISFSYSYDDSFTQVGGVGQETVGAADPRIRMSLDISASPQVEAVDVVPGVDNNIFFAKGYTSMATLGVNIDVEGRAYRDEGDMELQKIAGKFTTPKGGLEAGTAYVTQKNSSTSAASERKSYGANWEFISEHALSDHASDGKYAGKEIVI